MKDGSAPETSLRGGGSPAFPLGGGGAARLGSPPALVGRLRTQRWTLALLGLLLGSSLGVATAVYGLVVGVVVLVLALYAFVAFLRLEAGLIGIVGLISLLPFAVVPIRLGLSPTFLDYMLTVLLTAWLYSSMQHGRPLASSVLNLLVLLYLGLSVAAFLLGLTYSISPERLRLFAKSINSTLLFFSVINIVSSRVVLRRVVASLIMAAAGAACIALVVLRLPSGTAVATLSMLASIGYPSGPGVLRPIADTDTLRAIGTSIDPNVLGGLLMTASALLVAQFFSPRPVLGRRVLAVLAVPVLAALLFTYSRTAWGGLVVAVMVVATVRDRRLWLAMLAGAILMLALPQGHVFIERFQSGLGFQDRAAVMRLGEYEDAINLIAMYPWLGIGFGATPSIDLYLGVSSIYLLIGQEMGLIGLSAFLLVIVVLSWQMVTAFAAARDDEMRGLLLSLGAAVAAVVAAGLFDHYFANIQFPHMVALFWLYLGLSAAATRLAREESGTR